MSCGCICTGGSDYGPTVSTESMPVARKAHRCVECKETIAKGKVYERISGQWEGDWRTYTTCAECREIRAALCCDGYIFGQLWEDVREQIFREGGLSVDCIDSLTTAAAKHKLQGEYMSFVSELP
jgi:hypothetical protein